MDKQRMRTFLVGGVAGVIAGILLAPRSGRELRGNISNRAGEARERGRERYFDVGESVRERISRARDGAPVRTPEGDADFEVAATVGESPAPDGEWPPLRDVSRDAPVAEDDPFAESIVADDIVADDAVVDEASDSRSEELRRKIRETRERLDGKREDTGEEDPR